jgi:Fe-S cluster biosynthesis and repair protein YggX
VSSDDFHCVRCDRPEATPLARPPIPGDLGERVLAEICDPCWEDWKRHQMALINHYGLDPRQLQAREFLYANLRAFLFGEGPAAEIDTSQEGSVSW